MRSDESVSVAVKDQLVEYFEYLANRIERLAQAVPTGKFWVKPFPEGNSVGHLIVHITGSLNHFIGVKCLGIDYERNRSAEFADTSERSVAEVLRISGGHWACLVSTRIPIGVWPRGTSDMWWRTGAESVWAVPCFRLAHQ